MSTAKPIPLCALIVGHEPTKPGASSVTGETEFDYNKDLARQIEALVDPKYCRVELVYRNGYSKLPGIVNATNADFAVELHFNASNAGAARGTEMLYWHKSGYGKMLATVLQRKIVGALDLRDRGILPRDLEARGGYLLGKTRMPCVIAEPFFGDNDEDWHVATTRKATLARAYADAIRLFARQIELLKNP